MNKNKKYIKIKLFYVLIMKMFLYGGPLMYNCSLNMLYTYGICNLNSTITVWDPNNADLFVFIF